MEEEARAQERRELDALVALDRAAREAAAARKAAKGKAKAEAKT